MPDLRVAGFGVSAAHNGVGPAGRDFDALHWVPAELEAIIRRCADDPDGSLPGSIYFADVAACDRRRSCGVAGAGPDRRSRSGDAAAPGSGAAADAVTVLVPAAALPQDVRRLQAAELPAAARDRLSAAALVDLPPWGYAALLFAARAGD